LHNSQYIPYIGYPKIDKTTTKDTKNGNSKITLARKRAPNRISMHKKEG